MAISNEVKNFINVLKTNKGKRAFLTMETVPLTNRSFVNVVALVCEVVGGVLKLFDGDKYLLSIFLNEVISVNSTLGIESEEFKVDCGTYIYRIYINDNIKSDKSV
jgi:hypothetical protein